MLLYGSPVYKHILLGIIPVDDETIPVSHIEPFHCPQNLRCDDLLVLAGRRRRRETAGVAAPRAAADGAGLVPAALRAGAAAGSRPRCPRLR